MKLLAGALALAASVLGGCATAAPDPDATCVLTHASRTVTSLKDLPGPLRAVLLARAGGMADRGEFFNSGDVVTKPAPFNRFIRGGTIGERWYAWYEHGGIAYWKQILIFGSDPSGTPRVIAEAIGTGPASLCAQTDKLMDGQTL